MYQNPSMEHRCCDEYDDGSEPENSCKFNYTDNNILRMCEAREYQSCVQYRNHMNHLTTKEKIKCFRWMWKEDEEYYCNEWIHGAKYTKKICELLNMDTELVLKIVKRSYGLPK